MDIKSRISAGSGHQIPHIGGEGGFHGNGFPGKGVGEGHFGAVEGVAGDQIVVAAVKGISRQGVAQGGEMDPDLVGAARFQANPHHSVGACPVDDRIMGHGVLAVRVGLPQDDGAFHPADRDGDGAGVLRQDSFGDSDVLFFHRPDKQARAQGAFSGHAEAGSVLVQAADRPEGQGILI